MARKKSYWNVLHNFSIGNFTLFSYVHQRPNIHRFTILNLRFCFCSSRDLARISLNNSRDLTNFMPVAHSERQKRILFVLSDLQAVGGVQSRLLSVARYLERFGWQCFFLTQNNQCAPLIQSWPNLFLDFLAANFSEKLLQLAVFHRIDVIEFQFKPFSYLGDVDLFSLKKQARVGCCFHSLIESLPESIKNLDYRIQIFGRNPPPPSFSIIHNALDAEFIPPQPFFERNCSRSRKALLVTRVASEKIQTIFNFAALCRENGLDFEIAGPNNPIKNKRLGLSAGGIPAEKLIGPIDTRQYLTQHGHEYLFIAGEGQVPPEVAVFGIPAAVIPHGFDWRLSTFITRENVDFLWNWNFVIRRCPKDHPHLGNWKTFFQCLDDEDLSRFNMREDILRLCLPDTVYAPYRRILEGV